MTNCYKIRQNLISIEDDFWIKNAEGEKVFKVDGKVLHIRKTLAFEDLRGNVLCQIKDTMVINSPNGADLAVVKKVLISPLRDHWDGRSRTDPIATCRAIF